jgi:proton-coupled amino acid transporter
VSFFINCNVRQAGEDLEEIEEEDEELLPDEAERLLNQPSGSRDTSTPQAGSEPAQSSLARILQAQQPKSAVSETSPLLPRSSSVQRSRIRRRRGSVAHGDATVGQAVLMVRHSIANLSIILCRVTTFFLA